MPAEVPKPPGTVWEQVQALADEFNRTALDQSKHQSDRASKGWQGILRAPGPFRAENITARQGCMHVTVGQRPRLVVIRDHTYTHQQAIVRPLRPGRPG